MTEAAGEAGGLESLYLSEAAAVRAYFLGGSDLALSEFNQARPRAASQSRRLATLLTETALLPYLDTVHERAHAWADQTLDPIIELKRSAGRSGDISDSYRMSLARQRFDDLLKSTDLLQSEIDQSRQTIVYSAQDAHGRVVGFFAGIAGAIGLLLVGAAQRSRDVAFDARPTFAETPDDDSVIGQETTSRFVEVEN